jgi:hypothetical protein
MSQLGDKIVKSDILARLTSNAQNLQDLLSSVQPRADNLKDYFISCQQYISFTAEKNYI